MKKNSLYKKTTSEDSDKTRKTAKQLLLFLCLTFMGLSAFGSTYYVSPYGTDNTISGTSIAPFKTISYAANRVSAGDIILVRAGTYAETADIRPASGTATNMIVFKPDAGAEGKVIISTGRFNLDQRHYIWIEGFCFEGYTLTDEVINLNKGTGNVVLNNTFKNITASGFIRMRDSADNIIRNNHFENLDGQMIKIEARSYRNLVTENSFISSKGIAIGCQETYAERGTQMDGDNVFAFNYFFEIDGNPFWFDRNGSGNVLLRNEAYDSQSLFFNESRCVRNWAYENIGVGAGGSGFESANYNTGHTEDARYINNVLYNCNRGFFIDKSWHDEVRNNIIYKTGNNNVCMRFTTTALSQGPHIFKNNLWFQEGKANTFNYLGTDVNHDIFAAGVGETDGLTVNPQFTDVGAYDFTLSPGSPAKGAGDNGKDLGAYPIYPKTTVGYVSRQSITGNIVVSFGSAISPSGSVGLSAKRGQNHTLTLRLNKVAAQTVKVDLIPIAGDTEEGVDFEFVGGRTVSFVAGQIKKDIQINFKGKAEYEQLIAFRLANAVNADIGASNLHIVRVGRTVYAGDDQLLTLENDSETKAVQLDGTVYGVPESACEWYNESNERLATGLSATVNLPKGTHKITLKATTAEGRFSDYLNVTVVKDANIWLELENGIVGSDWDIRSDANASGGKYVSRKAGIESPSSASSRPEGHIVYTINVKEEGFYRLHARVRSEEVNRGTGVSFYSNFDGADFKDWSVGTTDGWEWKELSNAYLLSTGTHTFTIAYRNGFLDKILITNNGTVPVGVGGEATNRGAILGNLTVSKGKLTPAFNPDITNYTVSVENNITDILLKATPNNGTIISGDGFKQLVLGSNIFDIDVTSEGITRTYTVTVARLSKLPNNIIIDFEDKELGDYYPITKNNTERNSITNTPNSTAVVRLDPGGSGSKVLNVGQPRISNNDTEGRMARQANFFIPDIQLPNGIKVKDLTTVSFDLYMSNSTGRTQLMRIGLNELGSNKMTEVTNVGSRVPDARYLHAEDPYTHADRGENLWGRNGIKASLVSPVSHLTQAERESSNFTLVIGSQTGTGNYFIDNIVIEFNDPNTYSNDATLCDLKLSEGTLIPVFSPTVTDYTATVFGKENITLDALANDTKAIVSGDGLKQLKEGENIFYVNVFAEDGTQQTYTVTVNPTTVDISTPSNNILHVFPNPVKDFLTIKFATSHTQVSLYDSFGRRLLHFTPHESTISIDMSKYPSGFYYLQVSDGIQVTGKKIIKR